MRYVSAYLLATLGGNKNPSKEDIKKILSSVGIEAEDAKADKVVKELTGKSVEEVIAKGSEKLASVPSGGGAVAAAAPAGAPAAAEESPKKGSKKEEKKEESEEEDEDMGFGLFD